MVEDYFNVYRENTIGTDYYYETSYGKKKMIYADWAASGRLYFPIEKKIIEQFGPYIGNTHSESSKIGSTMTEAYNTARNTIKKHVNANRKDVIIMTGFGTTSAINKLQRILGIRISEKYRKKLGISTENRPVVFVTHMEHHSNYLSWLETISEVVIIKPDSNGLVNINELEKTIKMYSNREIKIGAFTACSNVTGIQSPYYDMAKVMHKYGGMCFVDFAASAPYINLDMHPKDPLESLDAIYFSPHKFLGGPGTSGVLIFNSDLYQNQIPDRPGGGTVTWTNPWGEYKYNTNIESREDGGTPGIVQIIKTALCIELKNKMGVDRILKRKEQIMSILYYNLCNIDSVHILASNIIERQGILSFYVDNIHYNLIVCILNERFGIQARGGCSCAGPYGHYLLCIEREASKKITNAIDSGNLSMKPGWVRLSVHPIMTDEEIYYIIDSIKELIKNIHIYKDDYIYNSSKNEFTNKYLLRRNEYEMKKWFTI